MGQAIAASRRDVREWLRLAGVGVLSGLVAGLITAMGARLAMRIVAASRDLQFTPATLVILIGGLIVGIPFGLLFVGIKKRMPGRTFGKGLDYGLILLLVFAFPVLGPSASSSDELSAGPPLLGRSLFGGLIVLYGLLVGEGEERLERSLPAPVREPAAILGYGVLVLLAVLSLVALFSAVLSNILPPRIVSELPLNQVRLSI